MFESGGAFGEKAHEVFRKICNLITQTSGQSGSAIAYFWKSKLLVTLAALTYRNVQHWAKAHTKVQENMMDYYDQSASRKHCHEMLCSEATLKDRFAPFFAHTHKGAQRVYWPAANLLLRPSYISIMHV